LCQEQIYQIVPGTNRLFCAWHSFFYHEEAGK
jgi:hypothetical protein